MAANPNSRERLNTDTYRFGRSGMVFRGPEPDLSRPYVACIGGSETFGPFVEAPFPVLLRRSLGLGVANLGSPDASPSDFLGDRDVLEVCSRARACVVQVMPALRVNGASYALFQKRIGARPTPGDVLELLRPVLDEDRYRYCAQSVAGLQASEDGVYAFVENEIRLAWISHMQALLGAIRPPKILLWIAQRSPDDRAGGMSRRSPGAPPSLINRPMLDAIAPFADGIVEYAATPDAAQGRDGDRTYPDRQEISARRLAGGTMHVEAAAALGDALRQFLPEAKAAEADLAAPQLQERRDPGVFARIRVRVRPLSALRSAAQRAASSAGTASKRSATRP